MDPRTPKPYFQQTLAVAGKNGPYVMVRDTALRQFWGVIQL